MESPQLTTAVSGRHQEYPVAAGEHAGPLVLPAKALGSCPRTVPWSAVAAGVLLNAIVACHHAARSARWREDGDGGTLSCQEGSTWYLVTTNLWVRCAVYIISRTLRLLLGQSMSKLNMLTHMCAVGCASCGRMR